MFMVLVKELAKEIGITPKALREKIVEYGFIVDEKAKSIESDLAQLIKDELAEKKEQSKVEIYEELIEQELEREIIKKQRKQTAGKEKKEETKPIESEEKLEIGQIASKIIEIPNIISVKEFSEKSGISAAKIIGELMKNGILSNINQTMDFETASIIATDLGMKIKRKHVEAEVKDLMEKNLKKLLEEDDRSLLISRPPIVSIMGHVDHGKTKLLDSIRKSNVVDTEAGHITQHIGAYQVEKENKKITFLDTPGHEAFTAMRARGAQATDIAILVVAADEGVKPQTIEALNHAKEAKIPVIVAINKIDKENANPERVKAELAEHGLQPEEWGGETMFIPLSALTGQGIDKLLESISVLAEVLELKANANRPAVCTVIESHLSPTLGQTATILVNTGTLKVMDNFVLGGTYGRIKSMEDHAGKRLRRAEPSTPMRISGLQAQAQVGDILQVVGDEKIAKSQATKIQNIQNVIQSQKIGLSINEIMSKILRGEIKTLKLIVKADTEGSLEAIQVALLKIKDEKVAIKIIHAGVGNISESDVLMASASKGLVIGFQVEKNTQVQKMAERENVEILIYDIIYKLTENMKKLLSGLLEPEIVEVILGKAEVKKIFFTKKNEYILGCRVINGKIEDKSQFRIIRGETKVGAGEITSLKKVEENVKEVHEGQECGIKSRADTPVLEGDMLECYKQEKRIRTL